MLISRKSATWTLIELISSPSNHVVSDDLGWHWRSLNLFESSLNLSIVMEIYQFGCRHVILSSLAKRKILLKVTCSTEVLMSPKRFEITQWTTNRKWHTYCRIFPLPVTLSRYSSYFKPVNGQNLQIFYISRLLNCFWTIFVLSVRSLYKMFHCIRNISRSFKVACF